MDDRAFVSVSGQSYRIRHLLAAFGASATLCVTHSSPAFATGRPVVWSAAAGAPVPRSGLPGLTAVDAGDYHVVGLPSQGTVVCWGGVEAFGFRPSSVTDAARIAVSESNAAAVRADGSLMIACQASSQIPLCSPPSLSDRVLAISMGERFAVVLVENQPCMADLDADGSVGASDLSAVLAAWGAHPKGHAADLNGDGQVGAPDIATLLAAWGGCP